MPSHASDTGTTEYVATSEGTTEENTIATTEKNTEEIATATTEESSTAESVVKEKPGWKKTKKGKYYVKKNGSRAVGSYKIKKTYYIFDEDGFLVSKKKASHVNVNGKLYYAGKSGKALTGWHIMNNKLYYADSKGKLKTSTTYQGITLKSNGAAKMDSQGLWKKEALSIVNSITTAKMSKSQKLRACWNYMVSRSRFQYVSKYPNINEANWQKKTAYNMFTTHTGNCYSFACGFAALACEVGYDAYVVCGRVSGSRDGAGDGLTRHAWVRINGLYYDPEAQFAGWCTGLYGSSSYYIRNEVIKVVQYKKTAASSERSSEKAKGWTKDKKSYYLKSGKKATGVWYIKQKLYYFSKKGVYNAKKTKQIRKAATYEKDITDLAKLLGKPKSKKYMDSCYGPGKDGIWTYAHFKVYTYKDTDGKEIFLGIEK
jgi:hypothetical protein